MGLHFEFQLSGCRIVRQERGFYSYAAFIALVIDIIRLSIINMNFHLTTSVPGMILRQKQGNQKTNQFVWLF
jgi:hypothetical protein